MPAEGTVVEVWLSLCRAGTRGTPASTALSVWHPTIMADGSLSSVVSSLVRAQMGVSVPTTVTDEDLDRHVADLILKEAKKKAEQYDKQGIRAYLPHQESNVPKTNKRFLSSIIRNTDDHNKSVLRAQALSAAEIRIEREAQERAERRVRAEEAAAAERARRSRRGRDDSRERQRRHRERSWERLGSDDAGEDRWQPSKRRREDHASERHGSRSARRSRHDEGGSSRRRRHRSRTRSEDEDKERRRRPRASRSRSPRGSIDRAPCDPSASKRPRSHSPSDAEDEGLHSRRRRRRQSSRSPDVDGAPSADSHSRRKRRSHRHTASRRRRHRSRSHSRIPEKAPRSETSEGLGSGSRPSGSRASSQPLATEHTESSDFRRKLRGKGKTALLETESLHERSSTSILDPGPAPRDATPTRSRSPSPVPRPPPGPPPPLPPPADFSPDSVRPDLPSKMDKYFEASYDPRLDVAPLAVPNVPATGLVNNAEFEGWDAMLELIKQRRTDKTERKRLERLGLVEKSGKEKKKSKSKIAEMGVAGTLAGWSEGGNALMDIEYKKRGSVREWDLGKETPT
ncbi:hypothetical protein EDB86DRAFT_933769 [Lactarius hatsudake]|nr:hypothetical protein EDB86DRAFT_933769 [Lactarius hatsudake]